MAESYYTCPGCNQRLSYQTTKHTGCPTCGYLPAHSAD